MLLNKAFVMKNVKFPPTFIFVGQWYVQHAGSTWRGYHCIHHRSYRIPENHSLPDASAFDYEESTALGSKKTAVSLEEGLD